MTDVALTTIPPILSKYNLNDSFVVERASQNDLSEILAIYNQSIAGKQATANLTHVTCEEREAWFDEHLNSATRPIYVVRAVATAGESAEQTASALIVAWGSYSDRSVRTYGLSYQQ